MATGDVEPACAGFQWLAPIFPSRLKSILANSGAGFSRALAGAAETLLWAIPYQVNLDMDETVHRLNATSGVDDNKDPHRSSPHSSPPPTKTDPSKIVSDAPPEGYKTFDIRVEWAEYGPREVVQRKRVFTSHPDQDTRPEFAKAWLAFDGFSSESALGPQTLNLFHVREKWRKLTPPASAYKDENDNATTAAEAVSLSSQGIDVEEVEAGTESMTETRTNETPSREWVPIIPSTPHSQQRPRPDSSPSKNICYKDIFNASTTRALNSAHHLAPRSPTMSSRSSPYIRT
ncbi:hypothetical protein F5888DRAFT_1865135 [Russula emetica]|nr:hypothetical protein F5888DRAFT_1865135 [Russula emetica]